MGLSESGPKEEIAFVIHINAILIETGLHLRLLIHADNKYVKFPKAHDLRKFNIFVVCMN